MTGPQPQVAFDVVAKNLADRVLAEVRTSLVGVADAAKKSGQTAAPPVSMFGEALGRLGVSAGNARKGMQLFEAGARGLAFQAAGATGPMGALARSVLQLGGGQTAVIAGVAGIGLVALAVRALTRDAREAAERIKKLREENQKFVTDQGHGLGTIAQQKFGGGGEPGLVEQLAQAEQRLRQARAGSIHGDEKVVRVDVAAVLKAEQDVADIKRRIAQLDSERAKIIAEQEKKRAEEGKKTGDEQKRATQEHLTQLQQQFDAQLGIADLIGLSVRDQMRLVQLTKELNDALRAQKTLQADLRIIQNTRTVTGLLRQGLPGTVDTDPGRASRGFLNQAGLRGGVSVANERLGGVLETGRLQFGAARAKAEGDAADAADKAAKRAATSMQILASSILLLGSVAGKTGTKMGGFLQGAGGLITGAGHPEVGLPLSIFGALVDLVTPNKPIPTHDDQLFREMQEQRRARPERISINLISPTSGGVAQFEFDAADADRRDANWRLPRPRVGG